MLELQTREEQKTDYRVKVNLPDSESKELLELVESALAITALIEKCDTSWEQLEAVRSTYKELLGKQAVLQSVLDTQDKALTEVLTYSGDPQVWLRTSRTYALAHSLRDSESILKELQDTASIYAGLVEAHTKLLEDREALSARLVQLLRKHRYKVLETKILRNGEWTTALYPQVHPLYAKAMEDGKYNWHERRWDDDMGYVHNWATISIH